MPYLITFWPLEWGHLANRDILSRPKSVLIRELPLYICAHLFLACSLIHSLPCTHHCASCPHLCKVQQPTNFVYLFLLQCLQDTSSTSSTPQMEPTPWRWPHMLPLHSCHKHPSQKPLMCCLATELMTNLPKRPSSTLSWAAGRWRGGRRGGEMGRIGSTSPPPTTPSLCRTLSIWQEVQIINTSSIAVVS